MARVSTTTTVLEIRLLRDSNDRRMLVEFRHVWPKMRSDVRLLSRDTGHDNWSAARRGESGAISGGFLVRGGVLLKYTHREHRVIRVARDDNNYRA